MLVDRTCSIEVNTYKFILGVLPFFRTIIYCIQGLLWVFCPWVPEAWCSPMALNTTICWQLHSTWLLPTRCIYLSSDSALSKDVCLHKSVNKQCMQSWTWISEFISPFTVLKLLHMSKVTSFGLNHSHKWWLYTPYQDLGVILWPLFSSIPTSADHLFSLRHTLSPTTPSPPAPNPSQSSKPLRES